jgi:cellobiose phosphorylase
VLDPIFSLRRVVRLSPGASTVLRFTTGAPRDRDEALALANRFSDLREIDRAFEEAISSVKARLAQLNLTSDDVGAFQHLAAHLLFTNPTLRSWESVAGNKLGQPGLWPHAISGDLPIMLLRISSEKGLQLTQQVLRAHGYWRWCGLVADLVVLNDA